MIAVLPTCPEKQFVRRIICLALLVVAPFALLAITALYLVQSGSYARWSVRRALQDTGDVTLGEADNDELAVGVGHRAGVNGEPAWLVVAYFDKGSSGVTSYGIT